MPEKIIFSTPPKDIQLAAVTTQASKEQAAREQELRDHYQRGRIEGEQALGVQLVQQRSELLDLQNGILASLQNALPQLIKDSEKQLVDLALEVARRLVANTPVSPEMVEGAIQEALSQAEESSELHIRLHPDDLDLLRQINSPFLLPNGAGERFHFTPSPEISRGGCIVQTRFGSIDAQRETKWQLLNQALQP